MIIVSAIKPETVHRLRARGDVTLELWSLHNVLAAEELQVGDILFLTDAALEDIRRGTNGVVARVERKNVDFRRVSENHMDEWEIRAARLRVSFISSGSVRRIHRGRIPTADIDIHDHILIG